MAREVSLGAADGLHDGRLHGGHVSDEDALIGGQNGSDNGGGLSWRDSDDHQLGFARELLRRAREDEPGTGLVLHVVSDRLVQVRQLGQPPRDRPTDQPEADYPDALEAHGSILPSICS